MFDAGKSRSHRCDPFPARKTEGGVGETACRGTPVECVRKGGRVGCDRKDSTENETFQRVEVSVTFKVR